MAEDHTKPFCILGSKGRFHPRYKAASELKEYAERIVAKATQDLDEPSMPESLAHPVEFDFPCSYTFRAYEAWQNGEALPDIERRADEPPTEPALQHGLGYTSSQQQISELKATINYLEGKINQHIEASKRRRKDSW